MQNQLQAAIGRARQEALGLQDYRGVVIFTDPNTGRPCVTQVYYPVPGNQTLELVPNHDEVLLPNGLLVLGIQDQGTFTGLTVLMFDGQGQHVPRPYTINLQQTSGNSTIPGSYLGARLQPVPVSSDSSHLPTVTTGTSDYGFEVLTDPGTFSSTLQGDGGVVQLPSPTDNGNPQTTGNPSGRYLVNNGAAFLINRYSGTLLRTE